MISFQRARQIAYDAIAPTWTPDYRGDYMVADYGFEDAHTVLNPSAVQARWSINPPDTDPDYG
ncbi:hypothetical protein [Pseudarthrobacter sp. S9]|uniref:hypothetical protein n=1 Tax=Pseudarthrobacter sp. S9 TaxID=3418421 RepID=UPI003D06EEF0